MARKGPLRIGAQIKAVVEEQALPGLDAPECFDNDLEFTQVRLDRERRAVWRMRPNH